MATHTQSDDSFSNEPLESIKVKLFDHGVSTGQFVNEFKSHIEFDSLLKNGTGDFGETKTSQPAKIKKTWLTLQQKIEAIKMLEEGTPSIKVAKEFGIGRSNVSDLRKRKAEYLRDYENNVPGHTKRRCLYPTVGEKLNALTLEWLQGEKSAGKKINGPSIQKKALQIASTLGLYDFKASNGWLGRFKQRYCLHLETADSGTKMAKGQARKPQGRPTVSPAKQASPTDIDPAMRLQKAPGRPASEGSSHRIPKDRRETATSSREETPLRDEKRQEQQSSPHEAEPAVIGDGLDDKEGFDRDLMSLEKFREQQKAIEEANKQKKALLSKTISERKKAAQAETHKLEHIQRELSRLDQLLTNDVQVIRNKIEDVSRDYLEAEKRFQRAEAEYVAAKIDLHQKSELKEQLTEHMYTIIHQNEVRKARKLAELAREMEVEGGVSGLGEEDLALPELPPLSSFQQTSLSPTGLKQHGIKPQVSMEAEKTSNATSRESAAGEKTIDAATTSESTMMQKSSNSATSESTTIEKDDGTVGTPNTQVMTNVVGNVSKVSDSTSTIAHFANTTIHNSTTDTMTLVMECSGADDAMETSNTKIETSNDTIAKSVKTNTQANHKGSRLKSETEDASGVLTIGDTVVKIEPGEVDTATKVPSKWDFDGNVS